MAEMSRKPKDARPGTGQRPPTPPTPPAPPVRRSTRWAPFAVIALILAVLTLPSLVGEPSKSKELEYSKFLEYVRSDRVTQVKIDQANGRISGTLTPDPNKKPSEKPGDKPSDKSGEEFRTQGPQGEIPDADIRLLDEHKVGRDYKERRSNVLGQIAFWVLPFAFIGGLWYWMGRRAQGQMAGIMNIGRSRAKVYTTEKPSTTFADVAGYGNVKKEITEVVDFLKNPAKFRDIGARIPKGVLLVGPPGAGKTLIARAVAGEAGVPFISVTGSDFMEMFVGVGAARVRDLFETARRQSPSIIFVDEIDSIGRKRGAGLGGGHDEREQTLNQLLSEMDGFETTEGIVMMAATNRPDVLDSALLRPGRFDRQVIVPLPTQEERLAILDVHCKDKRVDPDTDRAVIARGTPGMSGADLANLVNEAALFAVRRGAKEIHASDFDAARDRVLMGLRRDSMALTSKEKEVIAYHESGHALLAYVLEHADPVHKVTVLPVGMALGVTQQLPIEEKHIYQREYIDDSLAVSLGGRLAEELVFKTTSTGANNDLVRCTELARKMVREWGMSERIGPMAWGSQGAVFLGEDLVHTRDYSDDTARVIDEEVEQILRTQEERARKTLRDHRAGLDALAVALAERETLDGAEVAGIIDAAMGRSVGKPAPLEENQLSGSAKSTDSEVIAAPNSSAVTDPTHAA